MKEFTENYAGLIEDMMRRAAKKGRTDEAEKEYYITASDAKRIKKLEFPGMVFGKPVDFDQEERKLVVLPKDGTDAQEDTSEEQETTPIPEHSQGAEEASSGESEGPKEEEVQDFLMWVGYSGYPTIEEFVDEAERLGVSKRISRLPKGLVPGKSRILLAHDEGIQGDAVIFGYFTVEGAEMIVKEREDRPLDLPEYVQAVTLQEAYVEEERGCGYRTEVGALYLICNDMDQFIKGTKEAEEVEIHGGLVILDEYRDYNALVHPEAKRFRSFRKVDADEILASDQVKTAPRERAERTIEIPVDELPKAGTEWTDRERDELFKLVEKHGKLYPAFKEFERQTNRSMRSVEYQWFKMKKDQVKYEEQDQVDDILQGEGEA